MTKVATCKERVKCSQLNVTEAVLLDYFPYFLSKDTCILWVLKRTVSLTRFFKVSTTYDLVKLKEIVLSYFTRLVKPPITHRDTGLYIKQLHFVIYQPRPMLYAVGTKTKIRLFERPKQMLKLVEKYFFNFTLIKCLCESSLALLTLKYL